MLDSRGFDRKHAQLRPAGADWLVDGDPMEGALVILAAKSESGYGA